MNEVAFCPTLKKKFTDLETLVQDTLKYFMFQALAALTKRNASEPLLSDVRGCVSCLSSTTLHLLSCYLPAYNNTLRLFQNAKVLLEDTPIFRCKRQEESSR